MEYNGKTNKKEIENYGVEPEAPAGINLLVHAQLICLKRKKFVLYYILSYGYVINIGKARTECCR